jgi:hypothetical protein
MVPVQEMASHGHCSKFTADFVGSHDVYVQVSLYSWLSILGTTLMNPALIEIAIKYGTPSYSCSLGLT